MFLFQSMPISDPRDAVPGVAGGIGSVPKLPGRSDSRIGVDYNWLGEPTKSLTSLSHTGGP